MPLDQLWERLYGFPYPGVQCASLPLATELSQAERDAYSRCAHRAQAERQALEEDLAPRTPLPQ
ncbi:MAG TPA: hypothetical protein VEI97_16220 [bacterium]|nr:hypothetical protein [bacterium]